MSASSKRLCLEEGLEVACCDDERAELVFSELAATSPADGGFDDAKICVNDEPGDRAVDGEGDELGVKHSRSRRRRLRC